MTATIAEIEAGHAVYTKRSLKIYDFVVHSVSNRFIWKCPTSRLLDHYHRHLSDNHLDVGVGTGYFLQKCLPPDRSRVALMDLNPNTLDCASRRIAPYQPEIYQQNILAPITNEIDPFDSVAINYLLHCLPGSMDEKAVVLDNLIPLLNPKAVLFGSTILKSDQKSSWLARKLMKFYNSKGIFSNTTDTQDALEAALRSRFNTVSIELAGGVALFSAANAIQTGH